MHNSGPSAEQAARGPRGLDTSPGRDLPGPRRGQRVNREGRLCVTISEVLGQPSQAAHADTSTLHRHAKDTHVYPHRDTHSPHSQICRCRYTHTSPDTTHIPHTNMLLANALHSPHVYTPGIITRTCVNMRGVPCICTHMRHSATRTSIRTRHTDMHLPRSPGPPHVRDKNTRRHTDTPCSPREHKCVCSPTPG